MHLIDKKVFIYSFLMLVCSILFIVFWSFSAQIIIQTNWFRDNNIAFNELSSGIIVIICGIVFSLIYIMYEIIIFRFVVKKKNEMDIKRYKLYFCLLVENIFFTALTSLILFIISGKYFMDYLFKESNVINKKIEELKKKKSKKEA